MRKLEMGLVIMSILLGGMLLPILFSATTPKASAFSGSGSGTSADPYIITTDNQLQEMNDNKTAYYILGNNITMTHYQTDNGFLPIGNSTNPFTGSFDGKGHKISNLYINRPTTNYIGLFGFVGSSGVIENVGLENENITGWKYVGGLVGYSDGTVSNSYSTGSVNGFTSGDWVGGLVGCNDGAVSNSHSTCSVNGAQYCNYMGGLIGTNGGVVSGSYSTGSVNGSVGGSNHIGGLVGYSGGTVSNSYSTGSVSGTQRVGGFAGGMWGGTVSKSYSIGSVSGTSDVGGFVGYVSAGTISNSFWDNMTSGQSTSIGGTGKTTENMKLVRTFTDNTWSTGLTSPWDFRNDPYKDVGISDIWDIDISYPFLSWENNTVPTTPTSLVLTGSVTVGQTLTATASGSTDAENDKIIYYYRFINQTDNVERKAYSTSNTYTITAADNRDNIRVLTKAGDGYKNSAEKENSIIVANTPPTAPTGWTDLGMNLTDHTPAISWTKGTDADGDTVWTFVYIDTSATPTTLENSTTGNAENIGENSITLVDGSTYYYRLRSWDGYEYSAYTTADQFRMNSKPSNPTSWTDLGMNLTDHTPAISWTKGTDADGDTVTTYVYVGITSTPTTQETSTAGTGCDLGNTVTLSDGVTYWYRLRSYDGYEYSSYTTSDEFRMNSLPTAENQKAEDQVNPTRLTTFTPILSWNYYDAETDSQVWRNIQVGTIENDSSMWDNTVITSSTSAVYAGSALARGITYHWRMAVYDGYEWSAWRYGWTFRMNSLPIVGLTAPDNGATSTSIISLLDWTFADNDNDNQTKYWVLVDNDNNFSSPNENTGERISGNTYHAIENTLGYSTKYYWKVNVYDNHEWSGWYGVWNFTTGTNPNFPPTCAITAPANGFSATANVGIMFTSSSHDNDGDNLTYLWNFGDGTTSTSENQIHEYSTAGNYTVTFKVNDGYVNSALASITVTVAGVPAPPSGGVGDGSWIEQAASAIVDIVNPTKNLLFMQILLMPLGVWLLLGAGLSYAMDQKGIMYSLMMILAFLTVFGARIT